VTPALLLLAGLLTRVLVLLARVLVRVAHLRISLVERSPDQRKGFPLVAREHRFRRDDCAAKPCRHYGQRNHRPQTTSAQARQAASSAVAAPGSHC
jgi:hypothetical protein